MRRGCERFLIRFGGIRGEIERRRPPSMGGLMDRRVAMPRPKGHGGASADLPALGDINADVVPRSWYALLAQLLPYAPKSFKKFEAGLRSTQGHPTMVQTEHPGVTSPSNGAR